MIGWVLLAVWLAGWVWLVVRGKLTVGDRPVVGAPRTVFWLCAGWVWPIMVLIPMLFVGGMVLLMTLVVLPLGELTVVGRGGRVIHDGRNVKYTGRYTLRLPIR